MSVIDLKCKWCGSCNTEELDEVEQDGAVDVDIYCFDCAQRSYVRVIKEEESEG